MAHLYAVAVELIIFISGNSFWTENLQTAEISQSFVLCWNIKLCCFCRTKISSAKHKKKRKLLHRDACADARSCLSAILNQRREKEIEAFAETSCSMALLCFQCIGELDRLEALRRSFQDLDASSLVKTRYPIWILLLPRQLHINEPPSSGGSEQKQYRLFTRPFLPDRWRQFVKMERRKRSG